MVRPAGWDGAYWLIGPGSAGLAQGCRCAGRGHIVAASRTACLFTHLSALHMITLQSFDTNLSLFYFYLPIYLSNQIFKSRHFCS